MRFLSSFFLFLSCSTVNSFNGEKWLLHLVKGLPVQNNVSWRMSKDCKCGVAPIGDYPERIVGGVVSKKNAWPWIGAIAYREEDRTVKLFCGASIINQRYMLTAAHCAEHLKTQGTEKFQILVGTNDLNVTNATIAEISSVILHPKYNNQTKAFDVAVLKLKNPLKFSSAIAPICITPQTGAPYKDQPAIVVGWGSTMFSGKPVMMQMETTVNVTSNKMCTEQYLRAPEPIKVQPMMMCASAPGSDSCQGDSGGPLFIKKPSSGEVYQQIGIVSFGSGCADERFPGIYTRLGKVLPWIKHVTADSTYCT